VRFVGGLPVEPLTTWTPFPVAFGKQDYTLGKALLPHHLASLPSRQRKSAVLDAINMIEPLAKDEEPLPPQRDFGEAVKRRTLEGFGVVSSTIIETILRDRIPNPISHSSTPFSRKNVTSDRLPHSDRGNVSFSGGFAKRLPLTNRSRSAPR
jgi:hypothetical protein